jgi:diaminohydroxyphosphoribosylaminopyrimidine deaminase/5-amino-6-(5-phosphoribosylamino)uracil reductase
MHEQLLLAALEQARLGRGLCAPNPAVGAVAVRNGTIIAQAFHSGAGLAHAEALLLAQLPGECTDITVYVTLEPCNHWGKTPPCVDALITHGVARVVYGYADPNPLIQANDTPNRLRAAGIEVLHLPMPEIDAFYRSYTYWLQTGMPWVTVKMAQTLDGKYASYNRQPVQLSNAACAQFTHRQRQYTDVILTTARTINLDNPALNARHCTPPLAKDVAIIDSQGLINPQAQIFTTAQTCLIYASKLPTHPISCVDYHRLPLDAGHVSLAAVLRHLGSLGKHDVWVEAGAGLFSALHQAHLVQRTILYIVPRVLGPDAAALYGVENIFQSAVSIEWQAMDDNLMASIEWTREKSCLPV